MTRQPSSSGAFGRRDHAGDDGTAGEPLEGECAARCVDCAGRFMQSIGSPDDPRWHLGRMVADAWGPALGSAQRLGHAAGYACGYEAAEADMAASWRQARLAITETLRRPTFAELQLRRNRSADHSTFADAE
jgi:hypothetical protein